MLSFIKLGYNVLTPYGDCERYDFVVDINGKFLRIQCKTSKSIDDIHSGFYFSCRSSHRLNGKIINENYSNEDIDYFCTFFNGKCYLFDVNKCKNSRKIRIIPPKNYQNDRISLSKDYELEVVINSLFN